MFDKPNVELPLASSYNPRGNEAYETVVTNATDQRKVNSMYEPIRNSLIGKTTLYLAKRPGVTEIVDEWGTSAQTTYNVILGPGGSGTSVSDHWVFYKIGNDTRVSNGGTSTTIHSNAAYTPQYLDKTNISGTETVVAQLNGTGFDQSTYYANVIGSWTPISSSVFQGVSRRGKMEHMDGYAFILTNLNRILNSDPNSLDNWTATSYLTKSIQQDVPCGLAKFKNLIVAFGHKTTEVFRNVGNPVGSPLRTIPELSVRVGIQDPTVIGPDLTSYYTVIKDKLYFLGRHTVYGGGLWTFDGANFIKVSSTGIDKMLTGVPEGRTSVNSVNLKGQTAVAIGLTDPDDGTHRWLMYFPEWNDWFEWVSTRFSPVNNGFVFIGSGNNPSKTYWFDIESEIFQDDGTNYDFIHQFKLPGDGNSRKRMDMFGVKGDTARSAQSLSVQFSDDDYQNFNTARTIDMTAQRKLLSRGGMFRDRAVRLSYTGSLALRLEQFLARIT